MMEKKSLLILILFVILFNPSLIYAENLNLKITGTVNNITSDVYLKINPSSTSVVDPYDMFAKDLPSGNYSQFYSNVSSNKLSIDSWATNPRTVSLVYTLSAAQTGSMSFSWVALTGTYDATFVDYGDDSTYSTVAGSANMRTSSSYTTTLTGDSDIYIKIVASDYAAPATAEAATGSSGGGGGGGAPSTKTPVSIDTKDLEIPLVINTVKTRKITITNPGNSSMNVRIQTQGLEDIISLEETSFSLSAGEKKDIELKFIGPEKAGIYAGKVLVNGQEIFVSVNVNTKELLFDAGIVIPDEFKTINAGSKLESQVTLIPMGENPRLDVTLNYVIKDFEGRTFFTESETVLIETQKTFKKEFGTQNLPAGNYVLGLELIYPNGVATSTSHFEIIKKGEITGKNYSYLIIIGLGIGILILIIMTVLFMRRSKNIKKNLRKNK